MKRIARLSILSASVALAGCVNVQSTHLSPNRYAPVPESEVHVYLASDQVPSGCERIALIHTAGDADWTDGRQLIAAARKRAGRSGANTLVINSLRDPSTGTRVAAEVLGLPAERKGRMIAYRCPSLNNDGTTAAQAATGN